MTVVEGWAYHEADENGAWVVTDPTMTELFKFGYVPADNSAIIKRSDKVMAERVKQVGLYDTAIHMGNNPNNDISGSFGMINGLPLYWMLGRAETSGDGVLISNMNGNARKPRIATRQEIDGIDYHTYGLTMSRLSLQYNNNMLWANCSWMGMKDELPAAISPSYAYPSNVRTPYNVLSHMTWDGGELKPTSFATEMSQNLTGFMGENGYYDEISEFAPILPTAGIQFLGSEAEAATMQADFEAKLPKVFSWTVNKASCSTDLITCTGTGYLVDQASVKGYGLETYYMYSIWCTSLTFTVVDGLTRSTFYGL